MSKRSRLGMGLALMAGALTACDAGMGPSSLAEFDAAAALADYQALDGMLGSEGWKGFRALGGAVSSATLAERMVELNAVNMDASGAPIISGPHRGKTFVYDATKGEYVVDESRKGAPATGVRFIVYREVGGKPDPSKETGYADLIDEGDSSAQDIALRLVVVEGTRTVLDYRTTLDENAGRGAITVEGFLRDNANQLDFSIDVRGSDGPDKSALDVAFSMAIDSRDFEIQGRVKGAKQGTSEMGDVDLSVRHGRESLRVDVSLTPTSLTGTIYLNGATFATVSGDPDQPTFTSADGDPLTPMEVLLLLRIVDAVEDVFDLFEDLLDPIDDLVTLAVIL